jgi:hypothetical protein
MIRNRLRECLFLACLLGLAILSYGWIIYPELGTVANLTQLAAFLMILVAACIGRTGMPPRPPVCYLQLRTCRRMDITTMSGSECRGL